MVRPSRFVFVGNVPFDATEEALASVLREAGPLASFRLAIDKETQKPRGYGFAEYMDIETAKSAVRNLNEIELGGRKLRIDFAESETADPERRAEPPSAMKTITDVVNGMDYEKKLEVLQNIKILHSTQPEQARALLNQNPQLVMCILQMMLMCGIIDASCIQSLLLDTRASTKQSFPDMSDEQRQLLTHVFSLSAAQVSEFPEDQKNAIMQMRDQFPQFYAMVQKKDV